MADRVWYNIFNMKNIFSYKNLKDAHRENVKIILIKKDSASSCAIVDMMGSLGDYINNFDIRNRVNGVYQAVSGDGEIGGIKISITDEIEEEFILSA